MARDEQDAFYERVITACHDYVWRQKAEGSVAEPLGWLVVTERQRIDLLTAPDLRFVMPTIDLTSALGSITGLPIFIAHPGDKIENWIHGAFIVDMRGDQHG